ncbi:MAG: tetratricopeptide repeat protein [Fimbriimonadales bacterium]|nr:tetratricopeptide repeat protein [Fimbriimonadales bacterium]
MNPDTEQNLKEVVSLIQAGEYPQAEANLRQFLSVVPDHAEAHFFLGVIRMQQQQWDAAIEAFERATQLDSEMSGAWHNLGYCYNQMGFPDRAVSYLERAIEVQPNKWDSHLLLGMVLIQLGRLAEAAEHLEQALQHGGEAAPRHEVYEMLALIHEALGSPERAAYYQVLLDAPPEVASALREASVEHLFLFPDAESAMRAADAYRAAGFEARFLDDPEEEAFCVVIYDDTSPEESRFEQVVEQLKQIAEQYGGEYDGWGVAV